MPVLILMRHAKSDWSSPGLSDHDRPLNKRGRRTAPMMGQKLVDEGIVADVILASSALRVQQTVERLRETWSANAELITEPALYLASPEDILQATQGLHESWQTAMIVGHNPGMCVAASYLAGEDVDMPTAAVAVFHRQGDSWDASNASLADWRLTAHWKPKEL